MNRLFDSVKTGIKMPNLINTSFVRHKKRLKRFLKQVQIDMLKKKRPNLSYFNTDFKKNSEVGAFNVSGKASLKKDSLYSKIVDITTQADFEKLADADRTQFSVKFPHSKYDVTKRLKANHYGLSPGAVGVNLGRTRLFFTSGTNFAQLVTMISIKNNYVLRSYVINPKLPGEAPRGYATVGGQFSRKPFAKTLRKNLPDLFSALAIDFRTVQNVFRRVFTFKCDPRFLPKVRTEITTADFQPGQKVNIYAVTQDRGFQGVMQRWGYHGLPATHGVTAAHRAPGAIGIGRASLPRTTKMAGQTGREKVMIRNRRILKIDHEMGVIYINGDIPGYVNHTVLVSPKRSNKRLEVMNFEIEPETQIQNYTNIY